MAFPGKMHVHVITKQKSLTFTQSLTFMRHKTLKQPKPKIVRTAYPKCAYVTNNNGSSNNLPSYALDSHQC